MFIVMTASVLLTPSGVKCSDVLRHMELLTEFAPRRLDCYKHGPPDGGREVQTAELMVELRWLTATSPTLNCTRAKGSFALPLECWFTGCEHNDVGSVLILCW